jgi:hypothetical protein
MSYQFSYIYLDPTGERNHVVTRPYEWPTVDVAMREAANSQPPERTTQWGTPTTKDVMRLEDWVFGWVQGPEYACAIAVHPTGMAPHLIGRIWADLVQYEAQAREAELRKRRTLFASAAPQPKVYLSREVALHQVNQRRQAEGKAPYTDAYLRELSKRAKARRAEQEAYEQEQAKLEELPPLPRRPESGTI